MKKLELSQQATVVALAAALPVITSTYKLRMMDATILALTGGLAVYNVNCLTKGNCNTWATLTAVSFFVMTLLQLKNYEGAEGETSDGGQGQDGGDQSTDATTTSSGDQGQDGGDQSTDATTTSSGDQEQRKLDLFKAADAFPGVEEVNKIIKSATELDPFASLQYMINIIAKFVPAVAEKFKTPATILEDVILRGDLSSFSLVITEFGNLLTTLTTLQGDLLNLAQDLVGNLTDLLKQMCENAGLDQINSLLQSFLSIHVYMEFITAALTDPMSLLEGACSLIGADGNLTGDAPFNTLFNDATGCIKEIGNATSVTDFFDKATTCMLKIHPAGGVVSSATDVVS